MAKRLTRLITKNSNVVNRPLPSSLLTGEAIVNTADGIVFYSGDSASTNEWTPAGPGAPESGFFEVGSNLYDLRLRNRITQYEGIDGAGLVGKFLSGTTNGFVLADIANITGVDSYLTGGTFDQNTRILTLDLNEGKPSVNITGINNSFLTGGTFNSLTETLTLNLNDGQPDVNILITGTTSTDSFVTGGTYDANTDTITLTLNEGQPNVDITGISNSFVTGGTFDDNTRVLTLDFNDGQPSVNINGITDSFLTGGTYDENTNAITLSMGDGRPDVIVSGITDAYLTGATFDANTETLTLTLNEGKPDVQVLITGITGVDSFVTGGTYDSNTDTITLTLNEGQPNVDITGISNSFLTGGTFDDNTRTLTLNLNDGQPDVIVTGISDIFVTGLTYNNSLLEIYRNEGEPVLSAVIDTVSALTVNNLTDGRVVYVGTGGILTDEAGFTYNDTTDTLLAGNINTSAAGSAFVGTGGLVVGSGGNIDNPGIGDVVIHGNLTVFGEAITAATGELYIEDNNIILNYNPTGNTSASSIGAGFTIQDGDGIGNDVSFDIRSMNGFSGITAGEVPDITEYSGPNGNDNRAFVTQLNDFVIRSNNTTTPDGVRVLAEFDILCGGEY